MVGFFGAKGLNVTGFIYYRDIAIYGSLGSPNVWGDVISMLESGKLEVKSIISHIMDMKSYDDFKNAMDMMVERRDNACKIILKP